jgi:MFS family permease
MPPASSANAKSSWQPSFTPALILLGLAIVINYVDRGNLSFAATNIQTELKLSSTALGFLLSAFFYSYMVMQFVIGGVVDRFGANRVLTAGLLVWSLATLATSFAGSFIALLGLRLLLGVGESVAFPCTSKLIAQNVPLERRGIANAVITAGLKFGPAVGALGAGLLIAKYGWRSVFLWLGMISLLWIPAWFRWKPLSPITSARETAGLVGYLQIFKQRYFWGCSAAHFCFNYLSYFLLTWLPAYFQHERHLSQAALSSAAGAFYLVDASAALFTGWFCDHLIKRGVDASRVRKGASAIGSFLAAAALLACAFAGGDTYYYWLLLAAAGSGAAGCGVFLFAQSLAGPRAVGQWSALQNGFGNFAGLIAPAFTGFLVDRTGHYFSAFAVTAAISVTGGLVWIFGVRLAPVEWAGDSKLR